jgi:hypothetical protein
VRPGYVAPPPKPFVQRHRAAILAVVGGVVAVAAIAIFAIKFGPSGSGKELAAGDQPAPASLIAALTSIPQSTFDSIGLGSASAGPDGPKPINAPALIKDGKPEVLYVGAEYCPYCAAERWPMIIALSRFGTFSNLHTSSSSASDVYPNTPTFSFYQSSYTSPYLSFDAVEQTTSRPDGHGGYTPLQSLSDQQKAILAQYDGPPYLADRGSIPFVDFGGKSVLAGATYNPSVLAGKTQQQIAAQLADPNSEVAKSAIGSANLLTAAICQATNQQPQNVCQSPGVQKAAATLGSK